MLWGSYERQYGQQCFDAHKLIRYVQDWYDDDDNDFELGRWHRMVPPPSTANFCWVVGDEHTVIDKLELRGNSLAE